MLLAGRDQRTGRTSRLAGSLRSQLKKLVPARAVCLPAGEAGIRSRCPAAVSVTGLRRERLPASPLRRPATSDEEVLDACPEPRGDCKADVGRGKKVGRASSEWFNRLDDERRRSTFDLKAA